MGRTHLEKERPRLTCKGKLNEEDDAKDHEHHVEDELLVIIDCGCDYGYRCLCLNLRDTQDSAYYMECKYINYPPMVLNNCWCLARKRLYNFH